MMRFRVLAFGVLVYSPLVALAQVGGGAITAAANGRIQDETGKPIPAAQIRYQRMPQMVKDVHGRLHEAEREAHVNGNSNADSNGAVTASSLVAGTYAACFAAPGYLASCDWGASHRIPVVAGQAFNFGTVTLAKAATVTIRVNDPLGLLRAWPANAGPWRTSGKSSPPPRRPSRKASRKSPASGPS